MILAWALDFALLAFSLAVLLCMLRLLRGPEIVDRVLALDTLYVNATALAVLLGLRLGTVLLFEAALIIAMLGFVGTVALGRYLARGDVIE
ncbi:K+/H+ antiporter subunit F [Piscinibacter sp. Jin2]|uniref:K+/H+ antiporter subunit F n=1 Tax=Aquariibacter lacus TaxID=2801332 RepID=A0A9X0XCD4_9BURK|nr:K+/H+ antiporter subunit F [Piscinibacter lacus]MBL0719682.1 K+/H+ antiporter subunit F [Piscinibacter lacus]